MTEKTEHQARATGNPEVPLYEGADRRVGLQAMRQWLALHDAGSTPALADLVETVEAELSPYVFILKEDWDPRLSVFVECGEEARIALGGAPLRSTLWQAAPEPIRGLLCDACVAAIRRRSPSFSEGSYHPDKTCEVRFRSVFLPLRSSSYPNLGYLFGTHRVKKFPLEPMSK